jgi:hypothetical protein
MERVKETRPKREKISIKQKINYKCGRKHVKESKEK